MVAHVECVKQSSSLSTDENLVLRKTQSELHEVPGATSVRRVMNCAFCASQHREQQLVRNGEENTVYEVRKAHMRV